MRFDSIASTFELEYYFDPFNPEHKEFSVPGHMHECYLEDEGERILTGYILSHEFVDESERPLVRISGYSKSGILEDCKIPPTAYPLESIGVSLQQISNKLLGLFSIQSVTDSSVYSLMNEPIQDVQSQNTQSVKDYLTTIARQKNIIISHDEFGRVVYTKPKKQKPVFIFDRTNGITVPGVKFTNSFNGQPMHSDIWVMAQASMDDQAQAAESHISNPLVPIVYRTNVVTQTSGDDDSTNLVARNALSAEIKNFNVTIELDRIRFKDKIMKMGQIVSIINPYIYLYDKTDLFIESITLNLKPSSKTATLRCVLPEVYTNDIPVSPFKEINLKPL